MSSVVSKSQNRFPGSDSAASMVKSRNVSKVPQKHAGSSFKSPKNYETSS